MTTTPITARSSAPRPPMVPLRGLEHVFGHAARLTRDPPGFLTEAMRDFGGLVRFRIGRSTAILVADPEAVRQVLNDPERKYSKDTKGYRELSRLLGNGLLTSRGDFWRRQRRIAQPAFHRDRLVSCTNTMNDCVTRMLDRWQPIAARGGIAPVGQEITTLSMRIVAASFLGTEVERHGRTVESCVRFSTRYFNDRVNSAITLPSNFPTLDNLRFLRERRILDQIVESTIKERRRQLASGADTSDLLTLLMEAKDAETGERMTDVHLRDEIVTIFLAGSDTTATALAWSFYLLSKSPHAQRALEGEVDAVLGDRVPSFDDVPKLKIASMIFKESMRLYPPGWSFGRIALQEDEVCGMRIDVGDYLFVTPYVTHRDPRFWPNPEGFDYERFTPEREAERPRYAYYPFGGGPRLCMGNAFAMMEGTLVLARVAQRFRLSLPPGAVVTASPGLTLRPDGPLPMTLTLR